jgi:hypothetical protein
MGRPFVLGSMPGLSVWICLNTSFSGRGLPAVDAQLRQTAGKPAR